MTDTPIFDRLYRERPLPQPPIGGTMSYDHMRAVGHGGEESDAYSEDMIDKIEGAAGRLQDLLPDDVVVVDWDFGYTTFSVKHITRATHPASLVFETDEVAALERYLDHIEDPAPVETPGPGMGQFITEPNGNDPYENDDPKAPDYAERHIQ